jgi:signal peptidase I
MSLDSEPWPAGAGVAERRRRLPGSGDRGGSPVGLRARTLLYPWTVDLFDRSKGRITQPWRSLLDWAVTVGVAIVVVLAFEAEVAKPFRIPTSSMEPTLHCAKPGDWCLGSVSDRVLANRLAYRFENPSRGQIVVFTSPARASVCGSGSGNTTFVKRLIGLPGEKVTERNGDVSIDGRPLSEPYVPAALRGHETASWPRIARDHYFFLGDDRIHSCDSRMWGAVPRSSLIGPVLLTYWPPNRISVH